MNTRLEIKLILLGLILTFLNSIGLKAQVDWIKYEGNPVLSEYGSWAYEGVGEPVVIYEDGIFKMWFSGGKAYSTTGRQIGYAESTDGINWTPNDFPVITTGHPGGWDEDRAPCSILRVNDTLKMWYVGSSDDFEWDMSIGYAWSLDNVVWNIFPDPVLEKGEPGRWDENAVYGPSVYFDGGIYHMWFNGYEGVYFTDPDRVGYATSLDGINWVKDTDHNPVLELGDSGTFFDTWVQSSCVLFLEDEFKMWFGGWDNTNTDPFKFFRIGYATSSDGVEWTVQNDLVEVLDVGPHDAWDETRVHNPSVLFHNGQFKMWYNGFDYYTYRIGYAYDLGTGQLSNNLTEDSYLIINPNPFENDAIISFYQTDKSKVRIEIYNQLGKLIGILSDRIYMKGKHEIDFNCEAYPSGIYLCVLKSNKGTLTTKMIKLD